MLSNPYQAYEAPTSRLINEMPTHCLYNQKTVIIDGIDQHASQNWIKKLKSFYKSKRHSTKQNFSINDTSTIMNYKQDESDTDSSFLIKSTTLTPLSAIDADAIYQDASLARSSSNLHVRHSPYAATNKADTTMYNGNQLSAPIDTVIGKPETATVEQETVVLPGDLVQGTGHQHDHRQPPQDDKKELDPLSLVMQYTLYSQHLGDSADKLSLTSSTSSSSSTSSGHTQCSRIKYEKTRDAESSSHSTIHSLYSTFATSTNDIHTIPYMQPVPCASLSPEWSTLNYYSSSLLRESPPELHKEHKTHDTKTTVQFVETLANDIWLGKQTVCEHEKVATWLGTNDPFRAAVLKAYMAHFDFENRPLDEAFRTLCGKLYFKAESQQMDRIIETFAKRYWECNPMELYHSADVVYAISYSLLLLNTDLHGVHEHHHKMKRSRFVRNTMDTITTLVLPTETNQPSPSTSPLSFSGGFRLRKSKSHHSLATSYRSTSKPSPLRCGKQLVSFQQQQPNNTFASPSDSDDDPMNGEECKGANGQQTHRVACKTSTKAATKSQSLADLSFYLRRQHSVTDGLNQTMDQKQWVANMELFLKDMYSSIKSKEILRLSSPADDTTSTPLHDRKQFSFYKLATEARNKRAIRRKRGQSAPPSSNTVSLCLDQKTQDNDLDNASTPSQYLQQQQNGKDISNHITNTKDHPSAITDYSSMEGWVMRKCLMQGTRQKAKQRNWIRCYLKIQDGKLIMQYRDRKVLSGQHLLNTIKYHGDDMLTNQVTLDKQDSFALNHSLSRVLPPPGWHKQRTHVVCLQMTDGASWLFQVSSHQKAQDWMRALNYQAALHSKEPLSGAITNIDYGWKNNNNLPLSLPTWELPISCMISNQLSKVDQLQSIHGYIGRLVCCVEHHRNLRGLVEKRFSPRTANRMKAMANWELKMQYLLFEKIKFQTYYDTLACSMVD